MWWVYVYNWFYVSNKHYPDEVNYEQLIGKYRDIKLHLKSIYKYVKLLSNRKGVDKFYPDFISAITKMYIHATAPINTRDLRKLMSSLYDIADYSTMH